MAKLLDLYSGGGGAGFGYALAGFEVTGVDIEPQPNYPFEFVQSDAVKYLAEYGHNFDVIHASPPCQRVSRVQFLSKARKNGGYGDHKDHIHRTRKAIKKTGKPYVIENVPGAPLIAPITLCGSQFNLKVYRHRLFESNITITAPPHFPHRDSTPSAGNGVSPKGFISVCGNGGVKGFNSKQILEYWSYAMGIDWMTRAELAQSIPPAFTHHIGIQIMDAINGKTA